MSTEWFYQRLNYDGFIVKQKDPEGLRPKPICVVYEETDAQLIIAAPEMLEALKALWSMKGCPCELSDEEMAALHKAYAAIAKAEGRQP